VFLFSSYLYLSTLCVPQFFFTFCLFNDDIYKLGNKSYPRSKNKPVNFYWYYIFLLNFFGIEDTQIYIYIV
jgi:hypothetical protein